MVDSGARDVEARRRRRIFRIGQDGSIPLRLPVVGVIVYVGLFWIVGQYLTMTYSGSEAPPAWDGLADLFTVLDLLWLLLLAVDAFRVLAGPLRRKLALVTGNVLAAGLLAWVQVAVNSMHAASMG